jgi:hypothetical protein
MPKISELSPAQLARHAFNVFMFAGGRHVTGARLIYQALLLNPYEPEGIRCLSDFLDSDGTEVLSAITLEYGLSRESPLPPEGRKVLDDLRFLSIWTWGFSKHLSGRPHLGPDVLKRRSEFSVDEKRYHDFIWPTIEHAGSLKNAFKAAHTLVGALGGLLTHAQLGGAAPITECFYPERYRRTNEYDVWLTSDTAELDRLEVAREEKTRRGDPPASEAQSQSSQGILNF